MSIVHSSRNEAGRIRRTDKYLASVSQNRYLKISFVMGFYFGGG